MSTTYISKLLREQVSLDARHRCGYCLAQQGIYWYPITYVEALDMNQPFMIMARRRWAMVGWHPPKD